MFGNMYSPKKITVGNTLVGVSTSNDIFYIKQCIDGTDKYLFTIDIIDLFDIVVLSNDFKVLTSKQRKVIQQYLNEESNEITTALDAYFSAFTGEESEDYFYLDVTVDNEFNDNFTKRPFMSNL